jgi:hypothetical protein
VNSPAFAHHVSLRNPISAAGELHLFGFNDERVGSSRRDGDSEQRASGEPKRTPTRSPELLKLGAFSSLANHTSETQPMMRAQDQVSL